VCAVAAFGVGFAAQAANVYVPGLVPDWNQPYDYPGNDPYDPIGPGPDPDTVNPDPYDAWCTPTAAANWMGRLEDAHGQNTSDGVAEDHVGARPLNAVDWNAGLPDAPKWHDYTAEEGTTRPAAANAPGRLTDLGWYMNTNDLGDQNLATNPAAAHTGTYVGNADEGINNFLTDKGSNLAGQVTTTYVSPLDGGPGLPTVKTMIQDQIDAGNVLLGHFALWADPATASGPTVPATGSEQNELDFETTDEYAQYSFYSSPPPSNPQDEDWGDATGAEGLGHTVTIVGYSETSGQLDGVIAHDNWFNTVRNVHVSLGNQLSAITTLPIPEPSTFGLLLLGGIGLLSRRRR
jgi:hypothetical protein